MIWNSAFEALSSAIDSGEFDPGSDIHHNLESYVGQELNDKFVLTPDKENEERPILRSKLV